MRTIDKYFMFRKYSCIVGCSKARGCCMHVFLVCIISFSYFWGWFCNKSTLQHFKTGIISAVNCRVFQAFQPTVECNHAVNFISLFQDCNSNSCTYVEFLQQTPLNGGGNERFGQNIYCCSKIRWFYLPLIYCWVQIEF
jgi:hypothetical protein